MKPAQLADLMDTCGEYVSAHGGDTTQLTFISQLLRLSRDATVAAFSKRLTKIEVAGASFFASTISPSLETLAATINVMKHAGASAAAKDVATLHAALAPLTGVSPDVLLEWVAQNAASGKGKSKSIEEPPDARIVSAYVRRLEEALGDERGFHEVFTKLQNDASVRLGELKAIAKQFAFAGVKSRPAALKKIHSRQDALMTSRAKSAATAGRIAG